MNTDSQSTNPFLMGGFDSGPPMAETIFNPFGGSGATDSVSSASNPFLQNVSSSTTTDASFSSPFNSSTNPFAQFFGTVAAEDRPDDAKPPPPAVPVSDLLFDDDTTYREKRRESEVRYDSSSRRESTSSNPDKPGPPRRPPPPRPGLPKETKDLIMSVTGALEATSSDLLERLQATRTPSPTPLRELHSPSPTSMIEVNDLLGDDDIQVPHYSHGEVFHATDQIQQEALNIFDAIANLSKDEEALPQMAVPSAPTPTPLAPLSPFASPPHGPQVPVPTSMPLAPLQSSFASQSPTPQVTTAPPSRPPPALPSRPPPPQLPIPNVENHLTNLLENDAVGAGEFGVFPPTNEPHSTWSEEQPYYDATRRSSSSSAVSATAAAADTTKQSPLLIQASMPSPPSPATDDFSKTIPVTSANSNSGLFVKRDASYVATRKASHDITAGRVPIVIPTRKKYSLDYSGSITDQNAIKEQLQQYTTDAMDSGFPPTASSASASAFDNNAILEAPKFPVMSTTPLMSCENIANERLYDEPEAAESIEATPFENQFNANCADPFGAAMEVTTDSNALFSSSSVAATFGQPTDDFDAFAEKFESFGEGKAAAAADPFDPFGGTKVVAEDSSHLQAEGFGNEATFDEFLALNLSQPAYEHGVQEENLQFAESWPATGIADTTDTTFTKPTDFAGAQPFPDIFNNAAAPKVTKTDSSETPPTPLFDEDVSQPLEPFPRTTYSEPGWDMQIRYPIRKKFTGQRFWKKVFVRLVCQGETPHLELVNKDDGKETLHHEWPLQPCYAISDIGAQQYDQFGKIFTVKIQFVVYKERPGVRPGQVTKAERLTNKLSQFAAYAIQGDYQGVKEFGSDLKKLGLPVEHSPQISLICKLGSHNYEDMKQFSVCVEDALFRLQAHRDNIHINYKMEEVQITAVDELYVEQNCYGSVLKQIARVRLFFLGFLTGMPDVDIGVNDLRRQGKEIVGRHDIIPVVTEEWIRLENVEFHSCVQQNVWEDTKIIKLKPPDACYLELMRFRVRPPKNRELPLQLKTVFRMCGNKVDILADIMVPGFTSRKLGQIPCEDVVVRIPIPECWIYLFRVEKHFRYGSVKSAHRRTGKIKGIERFLGAVDTLESHLIEVTSGHAKYEHHHRSIVWRMSRLPKEGQGAYTNHSLVCHLALTSYDQIPEELAKYCFVEFTMPITQVSHTTVRSVSICNSDSDSPPEKYVRHLARHEYKVEIEHAHAEGTSDYIAATITKPKVEAPRPVKTEPEPIAVDSDSDSE